MSTGKPLNNYMYQPLPADKKPYCYGIGGIDSNCRFTGLTREEAINIAEALNTMYKRPSKGRGQAVFDEA